MRVSSIVRSLPLFVLPVLLGASLPACGESEAEATDQDEFGGEGVDVPTSDSNLTAGHAVAAFKSLPASTKKLGSSVTAILPSGATLSAGAILTATRSLTYDGTPAYLVVKDGTLRSYVVKKTDFDAAGPGSAALSDALSTHRTAAITKMATVSDATEMTVTIDMCQSSKPWDIKLFDWLRQASRTIGKPVPVGIAMTGGWAKAHETQLKQMLGWQTNRELDIVWVNHSYTHPLNCNAAKTSCAFLTAGSVNMQDEVLKNEELLLGQGAVPSALFRFPGLIHNDTRMKELNGLSLFALDADSWLAKGQPTHDGSLILVHGNGNEESGITKFFSLASQGDWMNKIKAGSMELVSPLRGIAGTAE